MGVIGPPVFSARRHAVLARKRPSQYPLGSVRPGGASLP